MKQEPIRILQALTTGELGGTEIMVFHLATQLNRYNFACDVSILERFGPIAKRLKDVGIQVYDLSGRAGIVGATWRLYHLLRIHCYQIVHLYGFRMSILGRIVAQLVRPRPIVIHGIRGLHVTEGEEVSSLKTKFAVTVERYGARLIDAYVANSQDAVTFLCNQGLPKKKFVVIPNGINISEWKEEVIRPVKETVEIICVANFRPIKRHHDLIEALALLRDRGIKVRCLLVGNGVTMQNITTLVRECRLEDTVKFLGAQNPEEVKELLYQSDIFVLPSLWEGMPVSIMEAMAAGLPVIGTNVNGINNLVIDGQTGYLVPPKNPEALAQQIALLVTNREVRIKMGQAGRMRIKQEFSLDLMIKRTAAFYESLINFS